MASPSQAVVVLSTKDLPKDIEFFTKIGFRQDKIYPADNPAVAVLSGHGLQIELNKSIDYPPIVIHILSDTPEQFLPSSETEMIAPNGTKVKVVSVSNKVVVPTPELKFELNRLKKDSSWVVGRAGMLYRDLVPSRMGGAFIASHIHIPTAGPVPDLVHFHSVQFQLIFCYKGWVKLVYEDQGEPFVLYSGDCVIQPPEIRHRVLESGDDLQVIEIGVPAHHMTTGDHNMTLPTTLFRPERKFNGQKFCHFKKSEAVDWLPWTLDGFEYCDTGITVATGGVANVFIIRPKANSCLPKSPSKHSYNIHFTFVLKGDMVVNLEEGKHALSEGDSFTLPSNVSYKYSDFSEDLELLEVSLPN